MLRTANRARLLGVACVTAGVACDGGETLLALAVAYIVDQRPRPIERRRTEIARIPAHHVATRVAHRAADAFDGGVDRAPLRRLGRHFRERVMARRGRRELTFGACPLVEELAHVG